MKHRSYNLLLAVMMIPSFVMLSNKARAATGTLQMDDFSVPAGGTLLVPLTLNLPEGSDIGGFSVTLTYDKSVVNIAAFEDVVLNANFINQQASVVNNSPTTSVIEGFDVPEGTSLTGEVTLADIKFTAISPIAANTTIEITPTNFYNSADASFEPLPNAIEITASVTKQLEENVAPEFESIDQPISTSIGIPATFTAHAHDTNGDPLTYILGQDAPENATIDSGTGFFTWTPTSAGTFSFDIIVSDGQLTDTETVTIEVVEEKFDYVPDPFPLTPITNAEPGSVQTSNEITVTGINAPITIAIHGNDGEYSVNGGGFTSVEGTVFLNDKVRVRQTASSEFGATVTTVLHLAGLTEDFNVTTINENGTTATIDEDDECGRDCEKYKEYRRKFKSDENKKIYQMLKAMKKNDLATFERMESIYLTYKKLSDREREELSSQIQTEFKLFEKYRGYKHYREYKEKN